MRIQLQLAAQGAFVIVGHNIAYDMAVLANHDPRLLPLIFAAYEARAIYDTMLCEQLFDIARGALRRGRYSLDALAQSYLHRALDKSTWRMRYGTLLDTPIADWPEGARQYAKEDARTTYDVFQAQLALDTDGNSWLTNAPEQAKYAFSIHLMCVWGIRTDPQRVSALRLDLVAAQELLAQQLLAAGLLRHEKKGLVKNQKVLQDWVALAYRGTPPCTPKGGVAIDRAALMATGDPTLKAYAEYVANEKLLSTYIPVLEEGITHPINASFRLVETGRRGATKNMQTPPKKEGVRECYVPRPGYVFCSSDYDSLELRALAQVNLDLFGKSPLADLYRADPNADPHTKFAAENFLRIDYDEGIKRKKAKDPELLRFRQAAKAYNFGLPGGLGAEKFVSFARDQYGYELTLAEAQHGKAQWLRTWHMQPFFDYVSHRVQFHGWIEQLRSRRIRGDIGFCDAANSYFQGLAADGACEAHFQVSWACYAKPDSPLFGSRIVNFLHDELFLEIPEHRASSAAVELSRIMNDSMMRFTPDIPITTSPALMRHWSKKADSVYTDQGELAVWE
jgi:DNA polymerase I-like protein with 3'-5' exonuclease and polymerase domains